MQKRSYNFEYLGPIAFQCLEVFDARLLQEAVSTYMSYLAGTIWAVHKTGSVISERAKGITTTFSIELDDRRDIECFNLLPKVRRQTFSEKERKEWRLKLVELGGSANPPYQEELILDIDGTMYLKQYRLGWAQVCSERIELERVVKRGMRGKA